MISRIAVAAVLVCAPLQVLAQQDCQAYAKAIRDHVAAAADPARPGLCDVSLQQDSQGFVEGLNLSRCPAETRAAIGAALLNAAPLPRPGNPLCWQREFTIAVAAPAPAPAPAPAAALVPSVEAGAAAPGPLSLRAISTTRPSIPDEVCRQRLSGWVDLDFVVMPDGRVANVVVTASQPQGAFDAAAAASVAEWTYAPQAAPVKLRQRLPMSFADCRSEQLRARVAVSADSAPSQADCPAIAAAARTGWERFTAADSGRAVLQGEGAQVYSAPGTHCFVAGRKLKPALRLTAHAEYQGFSLVSSAPGKEESAVWVWSNQLRDAAP